MFSLQGTFSALALATMLGRPDVLAATDRYVGLRLSHPESLVGRNLFAQLLRAKDPLTGGFRCEFDACEDIQSVYCALAVAKLTDMPSAALLNGVEAYIIACQTYEGGMGSSPGAEAHGAFTYLGVASAVLAGCLHKLNCSSLLVRAACLTLTHALRGGVRCGRWHPNAASTGGQTRTWILATRFGLVRPSPSSDRICPRRVPSTTNVVAIGCSINSRCNTFCSAQRRTRMACSPTSRLCTLRYSVALSVLRGYSHHGEAESLNSPADPFHTCYALSALSVAQHNRSHKTVGNDPSNEVVRDHAVITPQSISATGGRRVLRHGREAPRRSELLLIPPARRVSCRTSMNAPVMPNMHAHD